MFKLLFNRGAEDSSASPGISAQPNLSEFYITRSIISSFRILLWFSACCVALFDVSRGFRTFIGLGDPEAADDSG